jgi:hypothetical protein
LRSAGFQWINCPDFGATLAFDPILRFNSLPVIKISDACDRSLSPGLLMQRPPQGDIPTELNKV